MPPSFDELSLRHLPDTSSTSFSFQIPSTSTNDLLLDNDDEKDFFQNADDTISTPGPSRKPHTPLTLSELTPQQPARVYQLPKGEPSPPHDPKPKQNPRGLGKAVPARTALPRAAKATKPPLLKVVTQIDELRGPEASPRAARLRTLRAEVDSLSDDSRESAIPSGPPSAQEHTHQHEHENEQERENEQEHAHATREEHPISSKKERMSMRPRQVVRSGGISKARSKPGPSSARTILSAPQPQASQAPAQGALAISEPAEMEMGENPDLSVCSTTSGGVAERLVMYSQKLIGSFGLFNTDNASPHGEPGAINPGSRKSYPTIEAGARVGLHGDGDHTDHNEGGPFTLSQVSPPKPEPPRPVSPATTPASPMRPSRKRPVSVASSHQQQPSSKKGKTDPATDAPHASDAPGSKPKLKPRSKGEDKDKDKDKGETELKPKPNSIPEKTLAGSQSRSVSSSGRPSKAKGVVKRAARRGLTTRPRSGQSRLAASSSSLSSSTATLRGKSARVDDRAAGGLPGAGSARAAGGHDADADAGGQRDTRVVLPPANPTRPVGFRFQLDARLEARKAEYEKARLGTLEKQHEQERARAPHQQHQYQHYHPAPDFKSLHAQLEAGRARRKENIQPVVPLPVELNTDARAREREKFDLGVREREREMARLAALRRKEREEEEEREVREMRRRAVPRAHEVPEWYREAPRRRPRDADVGGDAGGDGVGVGE